MNTQSIKRLLGIETRADNDIAETIHVLTDYLNVAIKEGRAAGLKVNPTYKFTIRGDWLIDVKIEREL